MSDNPDDFFVEHRDLVMIVREAMLNVVDVLEKKLGIFPTTSQIRKDWKALQSQKKQQDVTNSA